MIYSIIGLIIVWTGLLFMPSKASVIITTLGAFFAILGVIAIFCDKKKL